MPVLSSLLAVAGIWLIAVATPGPNFLLVVRTSATQSRSQGLITAAGVATGTVIWGCAGFFGIQALFNAAPWLYAGFKILGGCYLLVLGLRLLAHSRHGTSAAHMAQTPRPSGTAAFRLGLMTNLSNPKSALFVASVFATAMPGRPSLGLGTAAIALMSTISITWYVLVACLFTMPWIAGAYAQMRRWIDRVAGTVFIVFGIRLAFDR